jgi:hypothetical protein
LRSTRSATRIGPQYLESKAHTVTAEREVSWTPSRRTPTRSRRNIDRVRAVRADQLTGPTLRRDWDVAALLAHLIGGHEICSPPRSGSRSPWPPPTTIHP